MDSKIEWQGMPEYDNIDEPPPEITATFKFRNREDFEIFNIKMRELMYNNERVFDGSQKVNEKQAWYPLKVKSKLFRYVNETNPKTPRFPVYIVSKGRYKINPTSKTLESMNIPYFIIVEEQEYTNYCEIIDKEKVLILPKEYKDNYDTFWKDDDDRTGPGPARNFAWDHSIKNGYTHHWVMDDNITSFERFNKNKKINCLCGSYFYACEDFVLRYKNIAISGLNYANFYPSNESRPPYIINTRIYSCLLIKNDIAYRWRGRYNEDTDLSLRVLKDGLCTLQFNAFLQGKMSTQKIKGGNTDEFYDKEGTLKKSKMLEEMHPDVAKVVWKFNRWHHQVDYKQFKNNKLIKIDNNIKSEVDNFGMILKEV